MVSGSDYNELPIQTNLAVKLKSVNRIYSGQSRYIDLNDPTGNYQNTHVFADDGAFYLLAANESSEISHTVASVEELMNNYIQDAVSSVALRDFYFNFLYERIGNPDVVGISSNFTNDYLNRNEVRRQVRENLELNRTFALGFNNKFGEGWYVLTSSELDPNLNNPFEYLDDSTPGPNSWLVYCEYTSNFWRITTRGLSYVFESKQDCKFFFSSEYRSIDPQTGRAGSDTIGLLKKPNNFNGVVLYNSDTDKANHNALAPLEHDLMFKLEGMFVYPDGFSEPSRVKVRFNDSEGDGAADVPYSYKLLKNIDLSRNTIVHLDTYSTDGYPVQKLIKRLEKNGNGNIITTLLPGEFGYMELPDHSVKIYMGNSVNIRPTEADVCRNTNGVGAAILSRNSASQVVMYPASNILAAFTVREGINDLIFQWRHFAPSSHRIDPAISNIIDIFVLTREYNDAMISWRNAGADPLEQPKSPTELNLRTTFNPLEEFKMFSDEIIWRPVKFKLLFGQSADPAYRAKFKIVKLSGTSMSDGEIKSRVVEAMRNFFEVNNWDFGETFFFSELGAYVHRQLSAAISSIEIVPVLSDSYFGNLREIRCNPDELFFVTAQVSDIDIISANTPTNLRIK